MTLQTDRVSGFVRLALVVILTVLILIPLVASAQNRRRERVRIRDPQTLSECQQGPIVVAPCPADTVLVIFDAPVFDDDGIFVICTKKVPFCVPEGLQPEG